MNFFIFFTFFTIPFLKKKIYCVKYVFDFSNMVKDVKFVQIKEHNYAAEKCNQTTINLYSPNSLLIILPKIASNRAEQTLTAVDKVNSKKNPFSNAAIHAN